MRITLSLLLGAVLLASTAVSARARSLGALEAVISKRDMYFQPEDRAAPDFTLETADGKKVSLHDFRGKIVVLDFIYARCKEDCPLQSMLLAFAQQRIDRTPFGGRVEFVSVATDTEDAAKTAAIMRGYGAKYGFDPANWIFLFRGSGAPDLGIKTAARYGLKFEVEPDGDQLHGVVSHVIDQNGQLRARFHGLKFNPSDLVSFVEVLASGIGKPAARATAPAAIVFRHAPAATDMWPIAVPTALLALAMIWLAGSIVFFRRRRRTTAKRGDERG